jgi:uncharacterized membrane protein YeaQ/YmgE (transglycosylase-associated protein family)
MGDRRSLFMTILGFILFLVVAAACAWIADYFVAGRMPGGFWGAALAGLVGAWIGEAVLGRWGPAYGGAFLFPTVLGAAALVMMLSIFSKGFARGRRA